MGVIKHDADTIKKMSNLNRVFSVLEQENFVIYAFDPNNEKYQQDAVYFELARGDNVAVAGEFLVDHYKKIKHAYQGMGLKLSENDIAEAKKFLRSKLRVTNGELDLLEKHWYQSLYGAPLIHGLMQYSLHFHAISKCTKSVSLVRNEKGQLAVDVQISQFTFTDTNSSQQVAFPDTAIATIRSVLENDGFKLEHVTFTDKWLEQILLTTKLYHLSYHELHPQFRANELKDSATYQFDLAAYGELGLLAKHIQKQAIKSELICSLKLMALLEQALKDILNSAKHLLGISEFIKENDPLLDPALKANIQQFITNSLKVNQDYMSAKEELINFRFDTDDERQIATMIISTCDKLAGDVTRNLSVPDLTSCISKTVACFKANDGARGDKKSVLDHALLDYQKHIKTIKTLNTTNRLEKKLVGAMKCAAGILLVAASAVSLFTPFPFLSAIGLSMATGLFYSGIRDISKANKLVHKNQEIKANMKDAHHFFIVNQKSQEPAWKISKQVADEHSLHEDSDTIAAQDRDFSLVGKNNT